MPHRRAHDSVGVTTKKGVTMGFFKKIAVLFRRGPREGIYSTICQMVHDFNARYALESNGAVRITRADGAVMFVKPFYGGVFNICDRRADGCEWNVDVSEERLLFEHLNRFLNPDERAAP